MAEDNLLDIAVVKKKSLSGLLLLTGRNFFSQLIVITGFLLLSYFLNETQIGLYTVITEFVGILGYFSDIGLAAALIQQKTDPTLEEIRTTFTIQQLLVVTFIVLFFIFPPFARRISGFTLAEQHLLYAFVLAFFLSSLKTTPSVLLERRLNFQVIALIDLIEIFVFYSVAVIMAALGYGLTSYTVAILCRSILGVGLIYVLAPWPIGFSLKLGKIRHLFRFGIPYQLNTLVAVVKDRLSTVFVWGIIGSYGLGLIGWAIRWSQAPLRFVMDVVMKITFPSFSRMQKNPQILSKAVAKSIFSIALVVFPCIFGLNLVVKDVIYLIPKYEKWLPAVIPLYFISFNSLIAAITTPLLNALNAIGKISISFKLMLLWTALTWLFFPVLAHFWGYQGLALAYALVAASSVFIWPLSQRFFQFSIFRLCFWPFMAACIMAVIVFALGLVFPLGVFFLTLKITIAALVYFAIIWLTKKPEIVWFVSQLKLSNPKSHEN